MNSVMLCYKFFLQHVGMNASDWSVCYNCQIADGRLTISSPHVSKEIIGLWLYNKLYKLASSAFDPLFYCCSVNGKICLAEILSSKLDPLFC